MVCNRTVCRRYIELLAGRSANSAGARRRYGNRANEVDLQ